MFINLQNNSFEALENILSLNVTTNNTALIEGEKFDSLLAHLINKIENEDILIQSTGDYVKSLMNQAEKISLLFDVTTLEKLDADRGIAQLFIDGLKITDGDTQLPGDTGINKSGIDLFSASAQWQQAVYEKRGLDPGLSHTMRIVVTDQKNAFSTGYRVDVDSFRFTVPRVGHYLYAPSGGNCAGTCHEDAGLPDYIVNSQEAKTKITCMTCHHPHGTDYDRLVHQNEDYKVGETVTKGQCLHCHDGSVTE